MRFRILPRKPETRHPLTVDPLHALALTAEMRDIAICPIVRCEVGRGLRFPKARDKFHAFWNVMINVPTDERLWSEAENLAWQLDRQGTTLPLTDIVIACCAKRIGAVVLTHDKHFENVPGLRTIQELT